MLREGRLPDPARLLDAWEAGSSVSGVARDAVLLHACGAVAGLDEALELGLGALSARAAALHVEAFGDVVEGVLRCGSCGEVLEVPVRLSTLPAPAADGTATVRTAGPALQVRVPTTRDLLAVADEPDPAAALLARCVTTAAGEPVDVATLPPEVRARVDAAAEELAGPASVVVRVTCPGCGAEARAPLDVPAVLWARVRLAAPALLEEVAELAAAFAWSEADVLALSPARRRAYLSLTRAGTS